MDKERKKKVTLFLDELIKKTSPFVFNLAINEIWTKGTKHFTNKTIASTIAYYQEEKSKVQATNNAILGVDTVIQVYQTVGEIISSDIKIFEIMEYVVKNKIIS